MNIRYILSVLTLLIVAAGCDSGQGPDSILNHKFRPHGTVSTCTNCHNSTRSPAMDPLVTNGSGTYGKHIRHVQDRAIACERCHYNYLGASTHMNGVFDTGNPAVSLVNMNITGPAGLWTSDTGTGTGSCAGVACHGNATLDWYGTNTWTLPACTTCHASSFSSALDPVATNGTPPGGRHVKHVTSRNIDCDRCHHNYPSSLTHANGVLDTGDPAVNIVRFNIVGSAATWTNDSGADTGDCASVSCHGPSILGWYGTGTWTLPANCTICHSSSFINALDPLATNGTATAGKHVKHVADFNMSCSKCHLNYPSRTSHANGSMDTPNPAVLLVYFDSTNPTGTWINDLGPETGDCSSLLCHGTESPAWYGLAGVSFPPCVACHSSPIGSRRQIFGAGGDFGQNTGIKSHHVSGGNDPTSTQCQVCHDLSHHMGGTVYVRNADSGAAGVYNPASPSSLEPFCLSCHDSDGATSTFASGGTPTSPFIDGSVLGAVPFKMSAEISTHWAKSYGHKKQGLTCIGNGSPNTGCHGNGHGTPFVGLLSKNLTLPSNKTNWFATTDEADYELCFSCHGNYPRVTKEAILGFKQGGKYDLEFLASNPTVVPPYYITSIQTKFRDVDLGTTGKVYDDPASFSDPHTNLHYYHVQIGPAWNYRDSLPSSIVCISCHNVHGSNTQWGWVYDEIQFSHYVGTGSDQYGMIGEPLGSLSNYPTSCTFNCHNYLDITHSWFEPSDE